MCCSHHFGGTEHHDHDDRGTDHDRRSADHDDRVVPAHSFKYAAALQACQGGPAPVLIRIDTKSGHGASNTRKQIETTADIYAFVMHHLGVTPTFADTSTSGSSPSAT